MIFSRLLTSTPGQPSQDNQTRYASSSSRRVTADHQAVYGNTTEIRPLLEGTLNRLSQNSPLLHPLRVNFTILRALFRLGVFNPGTLERPGTKREG